MRPSGPDVTIAVLAASATGGAVVAVETTAAFVVTSLGASGRSSSFADEVGLLLGLAGMTALFAGVVFAVGLTVIGLPSWAVLRRLGLLGRMSATVAGAVLAATTAAALVLAADDWRVGSTGTWVAAAWALAALLLPGAAAGWMFHKAVQGPAESP